MKLVINNQNQQEDDESKRTKRFLYIFWLFLFAIIILAIIFFWLGIRVGKIGRSPNLTTQAVTGEIQITEDSIEWNKMDKLNIFNNKYFATPKIAPGIDGEYTFKINNATNREVKYNISMIEDNLYGINMKYKLKLENVYIVGSQDVWGDVENLNFEDVKVSTNSSNNYILEWYWENSENDTQIGETFDANYKLEINITTNLYEGESIE